MKIKIPIPKQTLIKYLRLFTNKKIEMTNRSKLRMFSILEVLMFLKILIDNLPY